MRKGIFTVSLAAMFLLAGCGQQASQPASVPANAVKVHVTASDFKWTLDRTTFQTGKPIDFIVKTSNGTHGFSIVQQKVSQTIAPGEKPVNVVWTPPAAGTYVIACDVFCGSGHQNMWTKIHVQ